MNLPKIASDITESYEKLGKKNTAVMKYQEVLNITSEGDYAAKAKERLEALGYTGEGKIE